MVYNVIKALKDIEWKDVKWINLTQFRGHWRGLVSMVMNVRMCLIKA